MSFWFGAGIVLMLVGYGGQAYLHGRRFLRERKARARSQPALLPTARLREK